jgi:hypothetical protein
LAKIRPGRGKAGARPLAALGGQADTGKGRGIGPLAALNWVAGLEQKGNINLAGCGYVAGENLYTGASTLEGADGKGPGAAKAAGLRLPYL